MYTAYMPYSCTERATYEGASDLPDDQLPPVRPIPPSPGGLLGPEDVVGRNDEIERAWELLDRASVRLNEPRRVGKTSVLIKMEAEPPPGWTCVRQSFQGVNTVEDMAARALSGIARHQRLSRRVRQRASRFLVSTALSVTVEDVSFELKPSFVGDPIATLEAALVDVASALHGERLLLAWDEVPDMVLDIIENQGLAAAGTLLEVLRRLRESPAGSSVRWLLTGSVGFHHALRSLPRGDSLVNDLDNLQLGPLSERWAAWLAESLLLGAGVEADQGAIADLAEVSGGIPYLVHLVAKECRDRKLRTVSGGDIEPLFDSAMNDLDQSQQATHFLSRLDTYYGTRTAAAQWVLDFIAERPCTRQEIQAAAKRARTAIPQADDLRELLDWLCLDHYLVKHVGPEVRYEWRYPPLARVWRARRA